MWSPKPGARQRDGGLFALLAVAMAVITFTGFARTYYLARWFDAPPLSALVRWHGLVFTAWIAVFAFQVGSIRMRRLNWHRTTGLVGAVLALAMVVLGSVTAVVAARHGHSPSASVPALSFLAIPLFNIATFAILIACALWLRRDGPTHKRLMALATIAIMAPAFARFPFEFIAIGGPPVFFGLTDLLVIAGMLHDLRAQGRLPSVWLKGGALLLGLQITSLAVAGTPGWLSIAGWLTR